MKIEKLTYFKNVMEILKILIIIVENTKNKSKIASPLYILRNKEKEEECMM